MPPRPRPQADWDPELVRKAGRDTSSAMFAGRAATPGSVSRIVKTVEPPK
jgi:hypothetical protein